MYGLAVGLDAYTVRTQADHQLDVEDRLTLSPQSNAPDLSE